MKGEKMSIFNVFRPSRRIRELEERVTALEADVSIKTGIWVRNNPRGIIYPFGPPMVRVPLADAVGLIFNKLNMEIVVTPEKKKSFALKKKAKGRKGK
jgi:hypothetical protein